MKTISIINLKGGVAKTLTADSMAHVLATFHNKRVLLVDNDKQGNTSKAFGVHSYDDKSISDVLTARRMDPREVIKKTRFQNIDVMPANMTLIRANMEVLMDSTRPQQTRLRSALNAIAEENFYDFCIIDNAPDINISTIFQSTRPVRGRDQAVKHPSASQHGIPTEIETADKHQNEKEVPTITPSQPEADSEPETAH